jgi:ankyrin repeat domain-containing protein 50
MRLFHIRTRAFHQFYTNIPPYVIASHRWRAGEETSYQDVQKQRNRHKEGYQKLQGFVEYIIKHMPDVEWLWIDTCCINQRDAAELSEAVNSMFKWYQEALVCLAYLSDVSCTENEDELRRGEWFTRGWTLQELVAPPCVIFLTRDWQMIGHITADFVDESRLGRPVGRCLLPLVSLRTGIPEALLKDCRRLESFSNEEKLSWMEGRHTTREEDMSYGLFGILNVAIGANYGEGADRARRRLLAEIGLMDGTHALPKPCSTVPFRRDDNYVEREGLMSGILFRMSKSAARAALVGLGGVGYDNRP